MLVFYINYDKSFLIFQRKLELLDTLFADTPLFAGESTTSSLKRNARTTCDALCARFNIARALQHSSNSKFSGDHLLTNLLYASSSATTSSSPIQMNGSVALQKPYLKKYRPSLTSSENTPPMLKYFIPSSCAH